MPPASHRVDLLFLPREIETIPNRASFDALLERWRAAGRLVGAGPGPVPIVAGGFHRLYLDAPGAVGLYTNQQGGFQVRCPATGANAALAFGQGVERWRGGGRREAHCPRCDSPHPLEDYEMRPPGGFGRFAVVFADAAVLEVYPEVAAELEVALGPLWPIYRRIGR